MEGFIDELRSERVNEVVNKIEFRDEKKNTAWVKRMKELIGERGKYMDERELKRYLGLKDQDTAQMVKMGTRQ